MCSIDHDPPKVHSETWHKARTPKKCCECSREIQPGERYRRDAQLDDYSWGTYFTCETCDKIWKWLLAETAAKRVPESDYHDDCHSYFYENLGDACRQALREWCHENNRCDDGHWWVVLDDDGICAVCP